MYICSVDKVILVPNKLLMNYKTELGPIFHWHGGEATVLLLCCRVVGVRARLVWSFLVIVLVDV